MSAPLSQLVEEWLRLDKVNSDENKLYITIFIVCQNDTTREEIKTLVAQNNTAELERRLRQVACALILVFNNTNGAFVQPTN